MRIAFTHAYCWPEVRRGAERFIQELGAALVRRGHEVTVLSSAWDPTTTELDGVTTVRLRRLHDRPYKHEADFGRRVLPRLLLGSYDAVHSMGRRDAVASIRAARFHPNRRTVITDLGLPRKDWWATQGHKEAQAVEKVVAGIDVYTCMSRYAADFLAPEYGRTDCVVVPGGVKLSEFRPADKRAEHPTILFSAALDEERKGLRTLIQALPLIAEHEPDVRLWLSGPGDPSPWLASAPTGVAARTTVLDIGAPKQVHQRYGEAWVTCLPSTHDSFGMALIESLACGTPLVVSTHGAPQELVDDGVTGELCEPHDAEGLAKACLRAFDLTRRPASVDRCRVTAARFDWDDALAPLAEKLYTGPGR